ncbi:TauD-domain-containing protein [Wilcoxina mikolae CBS 423.85]|nr:TauD-domain-containing protein [Wilcoxina mikolae CBS 423.85]
MAPHVAPPSPALTSTSSSCSDDEEVYDINVPIKAGPKPVRKPSTAYPNYLPTWDPNFFPPLPPFNFTDPGLRADPLKRSLLLPGVITTPISPKMGTEVTGLQLSSLSSQQRDELALLVSERKVVVFRDQDFADIGPAQQQQFANHFGKPNYQPVTGSIPGFPGFHIIYRDGNRREIERYFEQKSSASIWHHDVSYERQPPGYVVLCMLQCPEVGGDTVVASMTEAYKRLSPGFRAMLDTLVATHSSERISTFARSHGGLCRKDPVTSYHPLVRVHPVTGEKSLFVNDEWITGIQGWKKDETDWLIKYLMDHISKGHDYQIRLQWRPRTVVIFDNRSTCHTATVDYDGVYEKERHMFRLAAMAEKPIPVHRED